jgi:hypothetical protein
MKALVILAVICPVVALAAVALPTSVEDLARSSDAVVHAEVVSREARWSGDGKRISTWVKLRAGEVWAGQAGQDVVVVVPGGEVGEWGQKVYGAPTFEDHEEVVVFLNRDGPSHFRVNGLALGKFRVEGGQVRPSLHEMAFVPGKLRSGERKPEAMTLSELRQRVRSARP